METPQKDAEEAQEALIKAFFGDQSGFTITKNTQFILHKPTPYISQEQLLKYAICQIATAQSLHTQECMESKMQTLL